jgi:glycosyltransferase involved in cell wall biosynthesis
LLRALPSVLDADLAAVVQSNAAGELPERVAAIERRPCAGARRILEGLRPVGPASLVHGLDVELPLRAAVPTVTTVHDLALFDEPGAFTFAKRLGKPYSVRHAIKAADAVIAVSSFTAERVKALFSRDAVVVHEAPGPMFTPPSADAIAAVRARFELPAEFVLYVGNLEPRKDVPTLAGACRTAEVPLVLAGGAIATVDAPAGTRALGHVAHDDLVALYASATVVAYVSRYEGFALPPVEAMASGATVMATRVGALPDVVGDGVEFVPVGDAEQQAKVLRALFADPDRRAERRAAGLAVAAGLTWDAAARGTAAVYRSLGVTV